MIKLLVIDVDGTLTNGAISYTQDGDEIKSFDVKDGLAIASWIRLGRDVAIITGRESKIVQKRANELGIKYIYQKVKDKEKKLDELLDMLNISYKDVASIGDDLNDYKMLKKSALSFCPNDATKEIKELVDIKLDSDGGYGAVREMIDHIIKIDGIYEDYLKLWV